MLSSREGGPETHTQEEMQAHPQGGRDRGRPPLSLRRSRPADTGAWAFLGDREETVCCLAGPPRVSPFTEDVSPLLG